ncbi:MAG: tetratricopeptide repeat protein, partial [Fidelibacterota bacterium]
TANLQVIDIQTAQVLAAKSITARHVARQSADMRDPASIDSNALYARCVKDISGQFLRMVAAYDVQVRAAFLTDKLLPEVDQAIAYFRIGEWEDGMLLLEGTIRKSGLPGEVQAKAYYNLGLAETYAGQFEEAIEHLKIAMSLNPKSKRIQNAILRVKMEQESAEKLKEQLE